MSRILDIDMDFFLNEIAHYVSGSNRLDSNNYISWSENDFRAFLENRCFLSRKHPIKGRIITNHHEAFFFWDELINNKRINTPISITHIDSHSDMGLGDSGYVYLMKELMHYPIEKRRSMLNNKRVLLGNYLSYALACGWVENIDFVIHDSWENDILTYYLKNFDINSGYFEFKGYDESVDITMMYNKIKPLKVDPKVPFHITSWRDFNVKNKFDYLVFCQSPGYTPKTADFMLDIIKDYINEV